jgi:Protein of unknown function (DUF3892)
MTYVTHVRKEGSGVGTNHHEHIVGVCPESGGFRSNQEVVDSIKAGETWRTKARDGSTALIKPMTYCPHPACLHKPYITTYPDHTTVNNLDNLPAC